MKIWLSILATLAVVQSSSWQFSGSGAAPAAVQDLDRAAGDSSAAVAALPPSRPMLQHHASFQQFFQPPTLGSISVRDGSITMLGDDAGSVLELFGGGPGLQLDRPGAFLSARCQPSGLPGDEFYLLAGSLGTGAEGFGFKVLAGDIYGLTTINGSEFLVGPLTTVAGLADFYALRLRDRIRFEVYTNGQRYAASTDTNLPSAASAFYHVRFSSFFTGGGTVTLGMLTVGMPLSP